MTKLSSFILSIFLIHSSLSNDASGNPCDMHEILVNSLNSKYNQNLSTQDFKCTHKIELSQPKIVYLNTKKHFTVVYKAGDDEQCSVTFTIDDAHDKGTESCTEECLQNFDDCFNKQ